MVKWEGEEYVGVEGEVEGEGEGDEKEGLQLRKGKGEGEGEWEGRAEVGSEKGEEREGDGKLASVSTF